MTPQQEIEPLRTDFEDYMRSILKGDALAHDSGTLGYYCRETHNMWCAYQAAWNRRAPSPTEPAVDRDARSAQRAIADIRRFVNESSDKNLGMWIDDDIDTLTAYVATPASPAVPAAPTKILPTNESEK